jgi:hypothetical protein
MLDKWPKTGTKTTQPEEEGGRVSLRALGNNVKQCQTTPAASAADSSTPGIAGRSLVFSGSEK